jgi:DNA-binding transcriptional ArsR family regulator
MQLTLDVGVADLAATRFAVSPLGETIFAMYVLGDPGCSAVNLSTVNGPWARWARAELGRRPIRLPTVWPLVVNGRPSFPEWLAPAPAVRSPAIADELAVVRDTPQARIEASLHRIWDSDEWPEGARELLVRPAETLASITGELAECYNRLIAPHWERIQAVLDADIAYRATGMLANGGTRDLLNDLHPGLRWTDGTLTLTKEYDTRSDSKVTPGSTGLVLVPSVFVWPLVLMKTRTTTQITVRYPARGAATVWQTQPASLAATEALLGAPRARLLSLLRAPATPGQLARQLDVTPSAISQHLAVLHRNGLLDRQRLGRRVLYSISDLGLTLLSGAGRALLSVLLKYGAAPPARQTIGPTAPNWAGQQPGPPRLRGILRQGVVAPQPPSAKGARAPQAPT